MKIRLLRKSRVRLPAVSPAATGAPGWIVSRATWVSGLITTLAASGAEAEPGERPNETWTGSNLARGPSVMRPDGERVSTEPDAPACGTATAKRSEVPSALPPTPRPAPVKLIGPDVSASSPRAWPPRRTLSQIL